MTERKIAVIDLGSSKCRLAVFACRSPFAYRLIDEFSRPIRIGAGMQKDQQLRPEPMGQAVQVLRLYRQWADAHSVDGIIATATSAVRDAVNQEEFLHRVIYETGLPLRVLSGKEEAHYTYLAARNSHPLRDGLVADLGGGSLELTRVRDGQPVESTSLPLGAVRLAELFLNQDLLDRDGVRSLKAHIDQHLAPLDWARLSASEQLIAMGGTARTLARMDRHRVRFAPLHGYAISRERIKYWAKELIGQPQASRARIAGLKAERVDIIPVGALVFWRLVKHTGANGMVVSKSGLREGLLYQELLKGGEAALAMPEQFWIKKPLQEFYREFKEP